ncbi:hypothetical protein DMC30DRAFT_401551 [Rhodotorula diobovata]|uniref:Uncharacterized protein n=1 Tax=Rhodotorula diobovata TaxID=5288 RepID=A0A5C5FRZ6_9BASI|nr:hypothetical protein DMC30DRAFT_401551 [Rhodotorula diobovata]
MSLLSPLAPGQAKLQQVQQIWHRLTRPPLADLASALVVLDAEIARLEYDRSPELPRAETERAGLVREGHGKEIVRLLAESRDLLEAMESEAEAAHERKLQLPRDTPLQAARRDASFDTADELQAAYETAEAAAEEGEHALRSHASRAAPTHRHSRSPTPPEDLPHIAVHHARALGRGPAGGVRARGGEGTLRRGWLYFQRRY